MLVAAFTIGVGVLGVIAGDYLAAAIAVLAGAATALALLLWGVLSNVGREVAALGDAMDAVKKKVVALEKQGGRTLARQRSTEEMHKRTHQQVQGYSQRLEQLSMQVSFPVLQGRAPGEPVSTRFADYLDQPLSREGSRSEALLEQLAREASERRAFEDYVRANLPNSAESPPS